MRTEIAKEALDALPDATSTTVLKASAYNGVEIAVPPKIPGISRRGGTGK